MVEFAPPPINPYYNTEVVGLDRDAPSLVFSHDKVGTLIVKTGADQITWAYGLNTETIPTYGGEVVQILSAYVDNVTVEGTLRNYTELEKVHKFFIRYMNVATQTGGFDEQPMHMRYPHRQWHMKIIPLDLPAFRYGREVVAPVWRIQAHVHDESNQIDRDNFLEQAAKKGDFSFAEFGKGIGWDEDNPFTDPAAASSDYDPKEGIQNTSDFYTSLVQAYLDHDFDHLLDGWANPSQTGPITDSGSSGAAQEEQGQADNKDNSNRGENENDTDGDNSGVWSAVQNPSLDPFTPPATLFNPALEFSEDEISIGQF